MTAARAETAHPPRHPYVVVHVAVSLDGHTTGFNVDLARFYSLLSTWQEDITLTGADTILAQEPELAAAPRPGPAEKRRSWWWSTAVGEFGNGRHSGTAATGPAYCPFEPVLGHRPASRPYLSSSSDRTAWTCARR
jgi:hypothetical protein